MWCTTWGGSRVVCLPKVSSALACCIFLAGCKWRGFNGPSEVRHVEGEVVRGREAILWHSLTGSDWDHHGLELTHGAPPLPPEHELSQHAARWLGAFDALARRTFPDQLAQVPVPEIRVIPRHEANAFAQSLKLCLNAKVVPESGGTGFGYEAVNVGLPGFIQIGFSSAMNCRPLAESPENAAMERLFNAADPACQMRFDLPGQRIVMSRGCYEKRGSGFSSPTGARALIWEAQTNLIVLHSGLYGKADAETDVLDIIAHELSHYYRAHQASFLPQVSFYYRQEAGRTGRPVPAPELAPLAEEMEIYSSYPLFPARMEGQVLHPALFDVLEGFRGTALCAAGDDECASRCGAHEAAVGRADRPRAWGYPFPSRNLSASFRDDYRKVEALALDCGEKVGVDRNGYRQLVDLLPEEVRGWVPHASPGANAAAAMQGISAALDEIERKVAGLYERSRQAGIGYYTAEQEADELAIELLARAGISPQAAVNTFDLRFQDIVPDALSMGPRECREAVKNRFRDAGGWMAIPVGLWKDPHHSPCYRAFNAQQEIEAHGYVTAPVSVEPLLSKAAWKALRGVAMGAQ